MSVTFKIITLVIVALSGIGAVVDANERREGYLKTFAFASLAFSLLHFGEKIIEVFM